jgi:hypothetical protein
MTTFMKDLFVVDNDNMEESKLITKQYRFCLAAVMQSYNKQFSDSQGPDDTSFDEEQTCVTMLAKLIKRHGIYVAATNERAVVDGGGRRRVHTTKPPIQQLAFALCHDGIGNAPRIWLVISMELVLALQTDPRRKIVTDKFLKACTLVQEDTSDE